MKVGYLGPEGTFSDEAGRLYSSRLEGKVELFPYGTIHDLLCAADKGKVNEAVVPIENSIEGTIGIVTDMIVKEVNLQIRQELVIPIYHYLVAPQGVKLRDITDVISNPPALDQCKDYIRKHLPKARLHLSYSTAEAVRQVATSIGEKVIVQGGGKRSVFAAVGSLASAKLYGLSVVAPKINAQDNRTRFVVFAKKDHAATGSDKTSVVFSIAQDRPGGLHDVLSEIAIRNVNMTKIESRPSKKSLGDYYFFIDMQGHRDGAVIRQVIAGMKKKTSFFKLLGSYPAAAHKAVKE